MKVIYQKAYGVDVRKSFIVAVIYDSTKDKPKYHRKKHSYIDIARKILAAIYHMRSTGEVWNPSNLTNVETK